MTTQELEKKIKVLDTVMKRGIANDAKINVLSDLLNSILSDKNLQTEEFDSNMTAVKEKIEAYLESTKEAYETEQAADKALNLGAPSADTIKYKDMLDKLKGKSEGLNETIQRIASAKEAEMDSDMYIDVQKELLEKLKKERDDKKTEAEDAQYPLDKVIENDAYNDVQKSNHTVATYREYNKAVKELADENAKPASEARDQKIAQITEKIDKLKKEILSDGCKKYEETDKVEVNVGGTPTEKTFKELLDANESIEKFIDGDVKDETGNSIQNLKETEKDELETLKIEISSNPDLATLYNTLASQGFNFADELKIKDLKAAIDQMKAEADKARNEYLVAKNKVKAKKQTIKTFEKDQKLLEDENMPITDVWNNYVPASERNSLISSSNSFSGRIGFWRSQGSSAIGAFFKAFSKKNTISTMQFVKTQEVREAAKARKTAKEESFRKKLAQGVKGLTGKDVREVDKENAIKEAINEEDKTR